MSNLRIFPTFHFRPMKLKSTVEQLRVKYQHEGQVSEMLTSIKLPSLLKRIRRLNNSYEELVDFSRHLSRIDLNILATEFPYNKEDQETIKKIIFILKERYERVIGRRFWHHYQYDFLDDTILDMVQFSFEKENANFLGLSSTMREDYNQIFATSEPTRVINQMTLTLGNEKKYIKDSLSEWKIEEDSLLAQELTLRIIEQFIDKKWFVKTQGTSFLMEKLEHLDEKRYKVIMNNYLTSFTYETFDENLLTQLINRLGDPRKNENKWINISENAVQKVKMYLMNLELFDFFDADSERFNYWKKYLRYIDNVDLLDKPPVAAMYFGEFVAVEFANKGNAAYFYKQSEFKKQLAHKLIANMSESQLKDPSANFFIHKIDHRGRWQARVDEYMINYLKGNLTYTHNI